MEGAVFEIIEELPELLFVLMKYLLEVSQLNQ